MKLSNLVFLTLVALLYGCTTLAPSEISQDREGNNYWVKEEISSCKNWRSIYKESITASNILHLKSKELSYKCLINGPQNEGFSNENSAIELYRNYLKLTGDALFTSVAFNKCFGSENYDFYNSTTMNAIKTYMYSVFHCSTEMANKFKKADSGSEYLTEIESFLETYNKNFKVKALAK